MSESLTFRPTEENAERIEQAAEKTMLSKSALVNECIRVGLPILIRRQQTTLKNFSPSLNKGN